MCALALGKMPADTNITPEGPESKRWALASVHPSFVIRSRIGGGFDDAYAGFVADLKQMKRLPK
jgi:hypothetical protein